MKNTLLAAASMILAAALSANRAIAQDAHGAGPNGGVVFDLGSHHAEFTVDHEKQQVMIVVLDADGKNPTPIGATELIVTTKETKAANGAAVAPMTIVLTPQNAANGKADTFVGIDPGVGNVAEFAGTVFGDIDGKPGTGDFDEAAAGHDHHDHSAHDGVVAALKNDADQVVGYVELKLHDDKGDLEAWLGKDRMIKEPMDLPADSTLVVNFNDRPGKQALLRVRNSRENEDEDGKPNLRDGKTNYFIFPGDSGQDPTWLMGKEFKSTVVLSFDLGGKKYTTEEFTLIPHTHADGHGHTH